MGARMSKSIVETCMATSIYHPPVASYSKYSCQFIRSVAGDKLALLCVSPAGCSMSMYKKYTDNRHVVLYNHGNVTDLGECKDMCEMLANMLNAHVVVYDYPNYGVVYDYPNYGVSSKASMCESTLNASIEPVYSRFKEIEIPPSKIILMGQSLGSVPTLHLTSRRSVNYSSVILISPLATAFRAVMSDTYYEPVQAVVAYAEDENSFFLTIYILMGYDMGQARNSRMKMLLTVSLLLHAMSLVATIVAGRGGVCFLQMRASRHTTGQALSSRSCTLSTGRRWQET
jgi:pimeloyl-ACP methyl ester carboxylesterase